MVAVRVVQVAVHEVIHVIAVRHGFMAAARAVDMSGFVAVARRGAAVGIRGADFDDVFIDVAGVWMMQVSVVQVVNMAVVFHRGMAAVAAVLVIVMGVNFAVVHRGVGS